MKPEEKQKLEKWLKEKPKKGEKLEVSKSPGRSEAITSIVKEVEKL